jgi:hypothetical protein
MGGTRSGNPASETEARGGRKLVERMLRETVRRVVETGVEKIAEGPENIRNFVAELKLPKDIASYLLLQVDETKAGLYRVVAKEIQSFLDRTNLAEQLTQALGSLALEIKTEIRFVPTQDGPDGALRTKPRVKTSVRIPPTDSAAAATDEGSVAAPPEGEAPAETPDDSDELDPSGQLRQDS